MLDLFVFLFAICTLKLFVFLVYQHENFYINILIYILCMYVRYVKSIL